MKVFPKKKIHLKTIVIIAAAAVCLTMMISASLVGYYYLMPHGGIVDVEGNPIFEEGIQTAKSSNGFYKNDPISGDNYTIQTVTWTRANGRSTLAVWVTEDCVELVGLRAEIDGIEYPLEKKTFNISSGFVGYVTTDIEKECEFDLVCDEPAFRHTVTFQPSEAIPVESYSNGLTLMGTTSGRAVYLGVNDDKLLHSEFLRNAEVRFISTKDEIAVADDGYVYEYRNGYGLNEGDMLVKLDYERNMPADTHIVSLSIPNLIIYYYYSDENDSPAVSVPLPQDGETIYGEWVLIDGDGFSYVINSISREGDTLTASSDRGMTYSGDYNIVCPEEDIYNSNQTDVVLMLRGIEGCFGAKKLNTHRFEFDGELNYGKSLDSFADENGEIIISVWQMSVEHAGNWIIDFSETAGTAE